MTTRKNHQSAVSSASSRVGGATSLTDLHTTSYHAPTAPSEALTPVSGSGINTSFRDMIQFVDKHELVFAIGKYAVLQNIQHQELTFLEGQQRSHLNGSGGALGEITAMAICGKRQHLSVCRAAVREDGESGGSNAATVSIYSIGSASQHTGTAHGHNTSERAQDNTMTSHSRKKGEAYDSKRSRGSFRCVLNFETERFCGTALSHDGKLVCCQAANATWTLVVWDWVRSRQVAVVDVHCKVTRVHFNAIDMAQLSTSGGNLLRLWTMSEYTLKVFSSFKSGDETKSKHVTHYVDHVWLPGDCLVALLEDGDVQLIVNAELVQTIRGVHNQAKLTCMSVLSNGEGVVLGGSQGLVSIVRVGPKMMKRAEKEMQLQRRMRIGGAQTILSVATDPTASTLLCCTESNFGSYDLSDLCFLRGDDEIVSLVPLASTPISSAMERLSVSSRSPRFAGLCTLPTGDYAVNVWNLMDCHKCFVSHALEDQLHPLCVDIHPSGHELLVSFSSKVHIYVLLQDALCLAFEIQQKQMSIVQYSQTGSMFVGVHAANKMIYVYLSFTRHQREPQLVGAYRGFRDSISAFMWSLHDSSFFGADASGELRHCRLRSHCGGEVEDFIVTESSCRVQAKGHVISSLKTWRLDRDSHDFVLFVVEKAATNGSGGQRSAKLSSCYIRAWINGDLTRDAIKNPGSPLQFGESMPHDVTALGVGCSNLLFAGTASGAVLILTWKVGKRNQDGHQVIRILPQIRRVDLHTSPVCGMFFVKEMRTVLANATNGVVLACLLHHEDEAGSSATDALRLAVSDDDYVDATTTFSSIAQADEVALYNRNKIDLRKLRMMELDSELQQLKLENEMLTRQIAEQKEKYEDKMKTEIGSIAEEAEEKRRRLQSEMDARLNTVTHERDVCLHGISSDAQIAQDQYLQSLEKLQAELDSMRRRLRASESEAEDNKLAAEEREAELRRDYESRIESMKRQYSSTLSSLQSELELTRKQLHEVLRQQDQDQLVQMSMLSTNIEEEKARAAIQMTNVQGKIAGLHQELKMLLTALNEKDQEIQAISTENQEKANEIFYLRERLHEEHRNVECVTKEKAESTRLHSELKHSYENLQRLNNVHRSQIELLQKQLLPKDREIEQMQQYMSQLHEANQDIVVQANLSDRLRNESTLKAKKYEKDVMASQKRLEKIRHSIVVLQEELGELVKLSAVQEKSAIIGEVVRIHKCLTRQLEILQAKDDSSEEIAAELHRQNGFLLKNKHHLRHQMEIANKEKHKLVSALSFQNGTLMTELNALKKQNKELERKAKRLEARERERSYGARPDPSESSAHGNHSGIKSGRVGATLFENQEPSSTSRIDTSFSQPAQMASASSASKVRPKSAGLLSTRRSSTIETRSRAMI